MRCVATLLFLLASGSAMAGPRGAARSSLAVDSLSAVDRRTAADEELGLLPASAEGEIRFVVDGATFRSHADSVTALLAAQIPFPALDWVRTSEQYRAIVRVRATFEEEGGRRERVVESEHTLSAPTFEETRAIDGVGTVTVETVLPFAPVALTLEVEDLRSEKGTLLGKIRGLRESGKARARFRSVGSSSGRVWVSGLLVGSSVRDATQAEPLRAGEVYRGGKAIEWMVPHFAGTRAEVFSIYYEIARLDAAGAFEDSGAVHRVRYRVLRRTGEEIFSSVEEQEASSGRTGRIQRFSVANYPVGSYLLGVELLAGEEIEASSYTEFHVFWNDAAWYQGEKEVLDDARVLLPPLEFEEFEQQSPGERAAHLAALWQDLDPTPATSRNETQDEFRARLAEAKRRYGGLEGGSLSDRGRLYVRFGAPDEIVRVAVPSRGDNVYEVLAEEMHGSLGTIVDADDPRLGQFLRHHIEGNPSFEIWKYDTGGRPIIPDPRAENRGAAFVFVDAAGTGMYRLGYSSIGSIMF